MLLNLPTELVQLVLRCCDISTYLQLTFCCRTLLELASNSRDVLLAQLSQTPGEPDVLDSLPTKQLFETLLRRSSRQLFGAEFHSECKTFDFQGQIVDCRASTLQVADFRNQVLLVFENSSQVNLCEIRGRALNVQCRLDSPARQWGDVQVLQAAYDSSGVYVLHRLIPQADDGLDSSHPFVKQAKKYNANGNIFLAYHELHSTPDTIRLYEFPEMNEYEPLSFAATHGKFAISWQHSQHSGDYQVVLYTLQEEFTDKENAPSDQRSNAADSPKIINSLYDSYTLAESNQSEAGDQIQRWGPSMRLSFNDRGHQLLHHYRGRSLYGSFQRIQGIPSIGKPPPSIDENACNVVYSNLLSLRFSIGIPFFYIHQSGDGSLGSRCHWQYLALGIATHRIQKWTVACLLKSEAWTMSHHCDHARNLERGRRFDDWEIMAQLGGYRELSISHGSPIAASRLGTRIAIANWTTVSIWALEPHILIGGETSFYPDSWQLPEGFPGLRPIEIQLDAVCFQLRFTEQENELLALTDRGLMLLNLKSTGRGIWKVDSHGE